MILRRRNIEKLGLLIKWASLAFVSFVLLLLLTAPSGELTSPRNTVFRDLVIDGLTLRWNRTLALYTVDHKPIIWVFWHALPLPPIIALFVASVHCHNRHHAHLQIVTGESMFDWLTDVHPAVKYLSRNHQADYVRIRLLDEYGGAYVDADTIGLSSYGRLFQKLAWYDMVQHTWAIEDQILSMGALGPYRARTPLTSSTVAKQHLLLNNKFRKTLPALGGEAKGRIEDPLRWAEQNFVAIDVMNSLKQTSDLRLYTLYGETTVGQLLLHYNKPLQNYLVGNVLNISTEGPVLYVHHDAWNPLVEEDIEKVLDENKVFVETLAKTMRRCHDMDEQKTSKARHHKNAFLQIGGQLPWQKDDRILRGWIKWYMNNHIYK